jgi:hypothetical protein
MLLIFYAGDKKHSIEGRTKLAKLDFFVRYPAYLTRAAQLKGVKPEIRTQLTPESKMMRYRYGPWDSKYYDIFAYLVAKEFVEIQPTRAHGDAFRLTTKGEAAIQMLDGPEFNEIVERCRFVKKLFGKVAGNTIKDFIYQHFANIVDQSLGTEIRSPDVR